MRFILFVTILVSVLKASALVNGAPLKGAADIIRIKFSNGWICSGVYLDPYTILTAAHCISDDEKEIKLETSLIESENDALLDVKLLQLIPNPNYAGQYFPTFDVGVIKTTANKKFTGEFQLAKNLDGIFQTAILFGCGRTEYDKKLYFRTTGENAYIKLGSVLFFLGEYSNGKIPIGKSVSVAPNDSGGPIVDKATGKIVGVMTTTTLKDSINYKIPVISTGTSTLVKINLEFIQKNMGPWSR